MKERKIVKLEGMQAFRVYERVPGYYAYPLSWFGKARWIEDKWVWGKTYQLSYWEYNYCWYKETFRSKSDACAAIERSEQEERCVEAWQRDKWVDVEPCQ